MEKQTGPSTARRSHMYFSQGYGEGTLLDGLKGYLRSYDLVCDILKSWRHMKGEVGEFAGANGGYGKWREDWHVPNTALNWSSVGQALTSLFRAKSASRRRGCRLAPSLPSPSHGSIKWCLFKCLCVSVRRENPQWSSSSGLMSNTHLSP